MDQTIRRASWAQLDPTTLHDLVKLRVDVFVVEQECAYPEIDGRDPEPTTEHWWVDRQGAVASYLRVLRGPHGIRIGRVVTAPEHRGAGLAGLLLTAALESVGPQRVDIDAQCPLEEWYAAYGFVRTGPDFLEDGIPHLPMSRAAGGARG